MPGDKTVVRFENVSFSYRHANPLLEEANFSVRGGAKITLMGQNGAGKSTIFGLITGASSPESGKINIAQGQTIATAKQVMPREEYDLTIREFFQKCFDKKTYDIDPRIDEVLEVVNLKGHEKVHDRKVKTFSGGQQARLLLASALIQNPDILLLDEPTNNLDKAGIEHLTKFLVDYKKTCIVISHDADFLNAFTHGVLYLDVFTRKVEQYVGDYFDVVAEIALRMEKENRKNAQLAKEIQANKDKMNFFAQKGGKMRLVAKKMRTKVEEMEEEKVDVRKEDKTIREFHIPAQKDILGEILSITSFTRMKNHKPVLEKADIHLKRRDHLLLRGPNGIGKSTLLESIANGKLKGAKIAQNVTVGYYRQDFSMLNFEDTVFDSLYSVTRSHSEQRVRSVSAGFLISSEVMQTRVGDLSEGQKGLVAFARLVLQEPGLLILDEPTNHINFRHIPIIAEALNSYEGAMVLVSHVPEFVAKIKIDKILDLEK
ncbi:MAG: ATP-binding cassette domain-containing protein [Candidatus Kaiserbacteria bacterium]|nr:ATP-binding cassette domain-containing protein [Candidatus Kaiserbacteria bacterium]